MGLSEGRRKQRLIGSAKTRNAAWSNDASLPGQRLLASMGWSAGQSIGRSVEGMIDPVKVAFKMDNRGIGAQRAEREARASGKADAWIGGNGELGSLFERLNRAGREAASDGKVRLEQSGSGDEGLRLAEKVDERRKLKDEKRKRKAAKEQRKVEKEAKKARDSEKATKASSAQSQQIALNPRMAARSRYLRAKRLVGSDAASVNEILGIASPSTSGSSSALPTLHSPAPENMQTSADGAQKEIAFETGKKERKGKRKASSLKEDHAESALSEKDSKKKRKEEKRQKREEMAGLADKTKEKKTSQTTYDKLGADKVREKDAKRAKKARKDGAQNAESVPVVPMSAAASQPALPPSSDPSFDASGGGRVSHLSVQEYLQNKLIQRRAAVIRMRREREQGVWKRAASAAVGAA